VTIKNGMSCRVSLEALRSSETSVLTRATWRYIQEDGIFQLWRMTACTVYLSSSSRTDVDHYVIFSYWMLFPPLLEIRIPILKMSLEANDFALGSLLKACVSPTVLV
jgi:hypothetical protein